MRAAFILALAAAALAPAAPSHAQSAYSYPWCALYASRSGAQSCYFSTYQQCMASLEGIGGSCIRSPYYRGPDRLPRYY
jgi:hypothetical protein